MIQYFKNQLREIHNSTTLKRFGILLAISHIITYLYWNFHILQFEKHNIQWPFSFLSYLHNVHSEIELIWISLSFLTLLSFFLLPQVFISWTLLLFTFILKELIYFSDLSYSSNVQYILFLIHIVYLFLPNKRTTIKYLIPIIIINQALLKMTPDWLSGQYYVDILSVSTQLGQWLSYIYIAAEIILPIAILFSYKKVFTPAIILLGISLFLSPYSEFYIIIQLLLLIFFFLDRIETYVSKYVSFNKYFGPVPHPTWTLLHLFIFIGLQCTPWVLYKKPNSKFNGFLIALEPSSTISQSCQSYLIKSRAQHHKETLIFDAQPHSCDLYKIYNLTKSQCKYPNDKIKIWVTQGTGPTSQTLIKEENFCSNQIEFSIWSPNHWQKNIISPPFYSFSNDFKLNQIQQKKPHKLKSKYSLNDEIEYKFPENVQILHAQDNNVYFYDPQKPNTLHSYERWKVEVSEPIIVDSILIFSEKVAFQTNNNFYLIDNIDGQIELSLKLPKNTIKVAYFNNHYYLFRQMKTGSAIEQFDSSWNKTWTRKFKSQMALPIHTLITKDIIFTELTQPSISLTSTTDGKSLSDISIESSLSTNMTYHKKALFLSLNNSQVVLYDVKRHVVTWSGDVKAPALVPIKVFPKHKRAVLLTTNDYIQILDIKDGKSQWRIKVFNENKINWLHKIFLSDSLIQKYELPWRYKGEAVATFCGRSKICFFDPLKEKVLHRISFKKGLALTPPRFNEENWDVFISINKQIQKISYKDYVKQNTLSP